ncbi:serine/threonine-protein kinase [Salininema proteolyticum]|uniref:non-specific serine/threonine protein kinase n=1 Tax=Salininema proteolyticum TaxID=1607685 RepID=A0ABV8U4Q4_9ACTN
MSRAGSLGDRRRPARHAPDDPAELLDGVEELTDFRQLANGAYSQVWAARSVHLKRDVAVKIERRQLTDGRQRERFQRTMAQARVISQHPCIVPMYSYGVANGGHPYSIMELCPTSTEYAMRSMDGMTPASVIKTGIRVCDALEEIHAQGLVHGDVKPANILVNQEGYALLTDLGFASEDRDPNGPVSVTATPAFAAREVFNEGRVTPAGDMYALAATLYTLLSGTPPRFPEEGVSDINEVIALHDLPIPTIPGVSPLLCEMLKTALIDNPEGRPDAAYLRDALGSIPEESTGVLPVVDLQQPFLSPPQEGTFSAFASTTVEAPTVEPEEARQEPLPGLGGQDATHIIPVLQTRPRVVPQFERPSPEPQGFEQPGLDFESSPPRPVPREEPLFGGADSPVSSAPVSPTPAAEGGDADSRLPVPAGERSLSRRERRLKEGGPRSDMGRLIGLIGVGVLLVGLLGWGMWALLAEDPPAPLEDQSLNNNDYVAECTLTEGVASCVSTPTCYVGESPADLTPESCEAAHVWEAYAQGPLPDGVANADDAAKSEDVQAVCLNGQRDDGPLDQLIGAEKIDWVTAVHVPEDGDAFQCVAKKADDSNVTGSQFARSD